MKFVCDSCKAKYQIGDEKVAGKTLRMKCRRCGHLIQVAASVTEGSVSTKLPVESVTGSSASPVGLPSLEPSAPSQNEDGATIVRASPLFLFQETTKTPDGGLPRPTLSTPGAVPAPPGSMPGRTVASTLPYGSPGAGPRIVPPARASMSSIPPAPAASTPGPAPRAPLRSTGGGATVALAQSQPLGAPGVLAAPGTVPAPRPSALRSVPTPVASASGMMGTGTHSTSSPALYNGFQQVAAQGLSERPPASGSNAVLPTEDWYVGIAGVPLGPVRLAVLREKATQGQVNEDSLVWREGYDEWLPVKKVPALLEVVDEAKNQRNSRSSGVPIPAPSNLGGSPFRNSALTAALTPASGLSSAGLGLGAAAAGTQPIEPLAITPPAAEPSSPDLGEATVAQNVSPAAGLALGVEPPADAGPTILKDPFAAPASTGGVVPAKTDVGPASFGVNTAAAFGADKAASYQATESYIPGVPSRRKGMHPMVWAFIAMAAAFGGVAAWAVFLRQKDVVYVSQSSQPAAATTSGTAKASGSVTSATTEASVTSSNEPVASGSTSASAVATWSGVGPRPVASASGSTKKSSDAAPFDSSGFGGTTPAGPSATATGGGGNSTGQTLTEGQASGVVSRNTPRVRRACWDPQLQTRSSSAPNSVKVTASLQIAPNGSVKSASVSGGNEKHYPGLVSCIKAAVSTWSFPVTDEGGTVNVPFNFAAQ